MWLALLGCAAAATEVLRQTPAGDLRGISQGQVQIFRGIPYAQAPVGPLRWRLPVAMNRWEGVRLVWIHGGGFEAGAGSDYDGFSLVSFWRSNGSPALLVTFNYRLNVFGFLGSDELRSRDPVGRSTGNYGMQVATWSRSLGSQLVPPVCPARVGANLKLLGLDLGPRDTVAHMDDHTYLVSLHMTMPKSYDLYSAAIMQSGQDQFAHPFVPWAPAMDGVEIAAQPLELLKQEKANKVPAVIGVTLDDGARFFDGAYNLSAKDFQTMFQDKARAWDWGLCWEAVLPGTKVHTNVRIS
eukprot:Skav226138  [mRNA]  locus=scaffold1047:553799:563004:- [translate_table: standard]